MVDVEFFQKPSTANDVLGLDHNEIAIPPYATTRNHPSRDHSSIGATHLSIASAIPPYATTRNHPSRDHSSIGATHLSIASIAGAID